MSNLKKGCVGCVVLPVFAIAGLLFLLAFSGSLESVNEQPRKLDPAGSSASTTGIDDGIVLPSLPGLTTDHVHGNLESAGYATKTRTGNTQDETTSTITVGQTTYTVTTYGDSPENVWTVNGIVVSLDDVPPASEIQKFLSSVAMVAYDGADPTNAAKWVAANWRRHLVSKKFGKAEFEIIQGNRLVMLSIRGIK